MREIEREGEGGREGEREKGDLDCDLSRSMTAVPSSYINWH